VPGGGARPFVLKPDWNGQIAPREVVDVNLGHTPESFVRAAHAQLTGQAAPEALVRRWARELRQNPSLRRVDLVRLLGKECERSITLGYSDPWQAHPVLEGAPERGTTRQVGAVFKLASVGADAGCTHPLDADLERELSDAKWAGLDFLLLDLPEGDAARAGLDALLRALQGSKDPIRLALFDDCWPKWRHVLEQLDGKHWYVFEGKPLLHLARNSTLHVLERARKSELLEQALYDSRDAELLLLDSWNDVAAGTGIHRNYDYWHSGSWLSPEHFMRKLRVSQSTEPLRGPRRIGNGNVIG
jgi:hypothetical protein